MIQLSLFKFSDELDAIMPVIMKEFFRQKIDELCKGKITPPQFFILRHLERQEQATMTELALFMGVTTAAMTGFVERLVKEEYCLREYDSHDRRLVRIKLTSKGRELTGKINQHRRRATMRIFSKVSASDRMDYLRILSQIKEALDKEAKR